MSNEFKTYDLNDQGKHKLETISRMFSDLLAACEAAIPSGRVRALITTHLQEAHLFLGRGLTELKAFRKEDDE
jgi:hypothetical protein